MKFSNVSNRSRFSLISGFFFFGGSAGSNFRGSMENPRKFRAPHTLQKRCEQWCVSSGLSLNELLALTMSVKCWSLKGETTLIGLFLLEQSNGCSSHGFKSINSFMATFIS